MKKTKQLLALLTAMTLVLASLMPVFAANAPENYKDSTKTDGEITLSLPIGSTATLTGMKVDAYRMLKQVDSTTGSSAVALVPTDAFDAFFNTAKTEYDAIINPAEPGTTPAPANLYVTYDKTNNSLKIVDEANKAQGTEYISITVANMDDTFFAASLMEEILGAANDKGIAANAMTVADWARQYVAANSETGNFKTNANYTSQTADAASTTNGIKFTDLNLGYWVLLSSNAPKGVANVRTIMKLTGANNNGANDGEKNKVDATLKLEEQGIKKTVKNGTIQPTATPSEKTAASAGQILDYEITFDLQDLAGYTSDYTFELSDTMENQRLVYTEDDTDTAPGATPDPLKGAFTVTFTWTDAAGTGHTATYVDKQNKGTNGDLSTLVKTGGIDYGTYGTVNKTTNGATNAQTFKLSFNAAELLKITCNSAHTHEGAAPSISWTDYNTAAGALWQNYKEAKVTVTYQAEVMSDVLLKNDNSATWKYSNDPYNSNQAVTQDVVTTSVYSYGLEITKTFSGGLSGEALTTMLGNVTFNLYEASITNAEATPPAATPDPETAIEFVTPGSGSNYYAKADTADTTGTTTAIKPNTSTGKFQLYGLAPGYYILKETLANGGNYSAAGDILIYIHEDGSYELVKYNKSGADVYSNAWEGTVSLKPDVKYEKDGATADITHANADHEYLTFTVLNQKKFPLPSTGEMGVWLFGIGGVLLLAAAVYFYSSLRKKGKI